MELLKELIVASAFFIVLLAIGRAMRCPQCRFWFVFIPHALVDENGYDTGERLTACAHCKHKKLWVHK